MDELEAMIAHARSLGLSYIGISDHSKSAYYAGGLTQEKLFEQKKQIEGLREDFPEIRIFHGIESDILPDGSIDYDEAVWKQLDFIIASVHSHFQMDKTAMTERVLKAIRNPYVTILGHPTGRLLLAREPYAIDLDAVIKEIARLGKAIELNANPQRLDVDYRCAKTLLASGVFISINPDAHQRSGLSDIRYGVDVARKAGLPKVHILNALTACEVSEFFMRQGL
jgi:DNA polymerase (family 10)